MPFRVAAVAAAAAADGMALDLIDLRLWLKQLRQPVLMSLLRGGPGVPALLVTSSLQRRPQLPVMVQIVFIGLRVWLRQLWPPVLIWSCLCRPLHVSPEVVTAAVLTFGGEGAAAADSLKTFRARW